MESAAKEQTENFQGGARPVSLNCLELPLILRKTLQHFSNTELLKLSLVNKQWNYEARCLMRNRGNSIASLKAHSARDLVDFAMDLRRMNVVPFSGIKIVLHNVRSPSNPVEPPCAQEMAFIYNIIYNRLPLLKYFHVIDEVGSQEFQENNPRFIFIRKVLQDFCGVPEEIEITCRSGNGAFLQEIVQRSSFPNLKKLSFDVPRDCRSTNKELIKTIVSKAANLQELHASLTYVFGENVLNGSSAMLVPREDFNIPDYWLSESVARRIKMKTLTLTSIVSYSTEKFNRVIPLLLHASRSSLKSLTIDSIFAIPLMCYGICLENVTEFKMYMDRRGFEPLQPAVFTLLRAFDFALIFPNLNKVSIESRSSDVKLDHLRKFVRQSQAVFKKRTKRRAANIKYLSLSDGLRGCTYRFLEVMFPDIERLSIGIDDEQENPYGFIWKNWVNLKVIKVQKTAWIRDVPRTANLDSIFCGIFPEEVDELRGKDDEYLRCVNIVPVMPSITCLKNLREITIDFQWFVLGKPNDDLVSAFQRSEDPTYVFSKVTSLTAFARFPDLSVNLETNWPAMEKALSHMKPFASVVLTR